MRKSCHFPAYDQNSDMDIRLSDPDFQKDSNNLAIIWRFQVVTLTLSTWRWKFVVHCITCSIPYQIWARSNNLRQSCWRIVNFLPHFKEWASDFVDIRSQSNLVSQNKAETCAFIFNAVFITVDLLLRFETTPRQNPNLGQISKHLTPCKIREGRSKCL